MVAMRIFHTMENFFPHRGKFPPVFSTPWKTSAVFFHTVENFFPHRGKRHETVDVRQIRRVPVPECITAPLTFESICLWYL